MSEAFAKALAKTMNDEVSITENGAVGFKTTSNKLLDLNFAVSSLRKKTDKEVQHMFAEAYAEEPMYALRWLFMLRDVRGGLGERKSFRLMLEWLAETDAATVEKLIPLLSEYGRFDDLFCLVGTSLEDKMISFVHDQFKKDVTDCADDKKSISLLAKWMPSINTSSSATRALAYKFCEAFGMQPKNYRKALSTLRAKIDIVEKRMSSGDWKGIMYSAVPSKANLKYKDAFMKHDPAGRQAFLDALQNGETKINSAANFPTDIVYKYRKTGNVVDTTYEELWKALPQIKMKRSLLTVSDVSSSMWCAVVPASKMRAIDVSIALGLYTAEHLSGPFKDKVMTFSDRPALTDFSKCKNLKQKLGLIEQMDWGGSTNIEAVFDLVLQTAVANSLEQEDIPDILIVSDMEFNTGTSTWGYSWYSASRSSLFSSIGRKFQKAGYALPRLIYWNVNSRTGTIPLTQNENGVALVSGFSQNVLKMVMSNQTDPWLVLKDTLDTPRYVKITEVVTK